MGAGRSARRAAVAVALTAIVLLTASLEAQEGDVRRSHCAGAWYPADAAALTRDIDKLLTAASPPALLGKPLAIIAPHAGYQYSAPVAAAAYCTLRDRQYSRVIALAFSHRAAGGYHGVDVPATLTAYRTPLGDVPIDRAACDRLLQNRLFSAHADVDGGEHSLELQLPFLQRTVGGFRLVPLLVGRMEAQDYVQAAEAIIPLIDDSTLLVASTDFTHFGPRFGYEPFTDNLPDRLRQLAGQAAAPILACDFDGFRDHLAKTNDTICGRGPVTLLLRILSMHEGTAAVRTGFDTSGQQTGDWRNSVTYQSFVFTQRLGSLGERERTELLRLARRTVEAHLSGAALPNVNVEALPAALRADGACFVTLENHGRLRGCVGNLIAAGPLYQAVMRNAVSACNDKRFVHDPVTSRELDQLNLEISFLTPMKRIDRTEDIIVGRHGLLISQGAQRGVLLPKVAARRGWSREEFLAQTCRKAGLPIDAWKQADAEIYSFEAEVFGEPEPTSTASAG